jgi:hypothetical protein
MATQIFKPIRLTQRRHLQRPQTEPGSGAMHGHNPQHLFLGLVLRPRLILEIDIGELLPAAVLHDEGGANILD